jgi:uncharacterized protein (DUF111 family)
MKKNRPGILVTLLCKPEDAPKFEDMLFVETTTLGVRGYTAERRVLARQWESVHTQFGDVRIKVARLNGHIRQASPEFEDCRKQAEAQNVPLHRVMDEAMRSWSAGSSADSRKS